MMTLNYPKKENGMYILGRDQIDDIAKTVLSEYAPDVLLKPQPLRIGDMAQEHFGLTLSYQNLSANGEISGLVSFGDSEFDCYDDYYRPILLQIADRTILIDKSLSYDRQYRRRRYTITHEFSHRLLHRSYRDPSNRHYSFKKQRYPMIACRSTDIEQSHQPRELSTNAQWEEWQADSLAASLLMPRNAFSKVAISVIHHKTGRKFISAKIPHDDRSDILKYIADIFMVSKQATSIRLKNLNLMSFEINV
jgi:hypothetical protein